MSHNWWHKDDGMTSKEAVARTQANVREEARRPSTWSPPPKPEPPGPQFGGGGAGLPAGTFISPTSVGGGSTLPGGGFNIGHGEGQIDPGLAAAAGIGPAASGFSGTTVGQGEGITGIIGDDDTTGGGIVQAVIDQGTKVKETVSDLYKNYIQGKPIRTLTPKEIEMLMMGLGRYDPVEGFQASGASAYGALLNAIFGKEQKYRMDDEGNYIYDEDLPDEYEDKRMFTKEGIIDFMRSIDPESNILGSIQKDMPGIYYDVMGMPQTTGDLEELAGLDAQKFAQSKLPDGSPNPNYNPDMAQTIFNARQELDKATRGQGGGGGAGIMGAVPTPFTDVNNNGILDSLEVAQATTTPAATVPAATVPAAAIAPTPFDYSQLGPHFGPQYPGHYANLGIPGQAWPQYDYWNQIANAFPGMRNYG